MALPIIIGWLLKYAYLSYPTETVAYLEANVASLSRTAFRYALEKMPPSLRGRLMAQPPVWP
ncbi:MAG: DNA alkylation repair protein [Candidatus Bipolaricaulota bacterium]